MATNVDFDNLILRINAATDTLEVAVDTINNSVGDMEDAVLEAQGYASAASDSANTASNAVSTVEGLIEDLEQAVIIEEAPIDGKQYARINASWQEVVASGGGGGEGTVTSVNNITPDEEGNVTLSAEDVGALPDSYTPDWTDIENKPSFSTVATTGDYNDLTNKPSIPTQGITSIIAGDNITVDNTNPLQPVISATGGGGAEPFPYQYAPTQWSNTTDIYYGNAALIGSPPNPVYALNRWPAESPTAPLAAGSIRYWTGSDLINLYTAMIGNNTTVTEAIISQLPYGARFTMSINASKVPESASTGNIQLIFEVLPATGRPCRVTMFRQATNVSGENWEDMTKVWYYVPTTNTIYAIPSGSSKQLGS